MGEQLYYWMLLPCINIFEIKEQKINCLCNHLFRLRSKKTSKLRVTGLCAGNSPVTGEFLAQMASNTEKVSSWRRHMMSFCAIYQFADDASIVVDMQRDLRGKLDYVSASLMWSSHIISNTLYPQNEVCYLYSWKLDNTKTYSLNVLKHP